MKTVCIYHSIDLDGYMSAAIVKHWFLSNNDYCFVQECNNNVDYVNSFRYEDIEYPILDFIGYNYGQPIPDLSDYDKVIMVDISFPSIDMYRLHLRNNLIWIDHHISAIKDIEESKQVDNEIIEGLRDTKFAACELTWKYFMSNPIDKFGEIEEQNTMPEIVRLLGRYDCFGYKGTDEETKVLEFQYGARDIIVNYEQCYNLLNSYTNNREIHNSQVNQMWLNGKSIYQYLCTEAKQVYKNGFKVTFSEIITPGNAAYKAIYKFICINKERFNPSNFGIDYHKDGYDGVACFHYANDVWTFTLYSDTVDCSIIAKQYGGDGHKSAVEFQIKDINQIIK